MFSSFTHVSSPSQAITFIKGGAQGVLSRLSEDALLAALGRVTHGLYDFDGTLSPGNQWVAIQQHLLPEQKAGEEEDRVWYYRHLPEPKDNGATLDDADWFHGTHMHPSNRPAVEGAWAARSLWRLRDAGVDHDKFMSTAGEIALRAGVLELMLLMSRNVVISFGIEQLIQMVLEVNNLNAAVAANRVRFDDNGVVTGFDQNVVVSSTKAVVRERFCDLAGLTDRRRLLGTGDSVVDLQMMDPEGFNVLIMPPSEANRKLAAFRQNHLGEMWERLTMILVNDSLMPLVELIRLARARAAHLTT